MQNVKRNDEEAERRGLITLLYPPMAYSFIIQYRGRRGLTCQSYRFTLLYKMITYLFVCKKKKHVRYICLGYYILNYLLLYWRYTTSANINEDPDS